MSKEDDIIERIQSIKRGVEYRAALTQKMMQDDLVHQMANQSLQEKATDHEQEKLSEIDRDLYPKEYEAQLRIVKKHQIALELINNAVAENKQGMIDSGKSLDAT